MQSSASSTRPQAPASTAPVFDFVCLYTHDLRRKQKRWQDGRIKYHTHNKRVMVYDERGNFVGDTHWCEDYDLQDGDEIELERGGVIVQVAECTGSRNQDLSELVDKRLQEKVQRQTAAAARRHPALQSSVPHAATPQAQSHHRPLHSLIGTPTGHHGRALISSESPFEQRQKQVGSSQEEGSRPTKRRKREASPPSKNGYAQSLFGATLTLSGFSMSQTPVMRPVYPKKAKAVEDRLTSGSSAVDDQPSDFGPVFQAALKSNLDAPTKPSKDASSHQSRVSLNRSIEVIDLDESEIPTLRLRNQNPALEKKTSPRQAKSGRRVEANNSRQRNPLESASANQNSCDLNPAAEPVTKTKPKRVLHHGVPKEFPKEKIKRDERPSTDIVITNEHGEDHNSKSTPQDKPVTRGGNEARAKINRLEPSEDQPRTELRIKPRKKRGLLMVSEKNTSETISLPTIPSDHDQQTRHGPLTSFEEASGHHRDNSDERNNVSLKVTDRDVVDRCQPSGDVHDIDEQDSEGQAPRSVGIQSRRQVKHYFDPLWDGSYSDIPRPGREGTAKEQRICPRSPPLSNAVSTGEPRQLRGRPARRKHISDDEGEDASGSQMAERIAQRPVASKGGEYGLRDGVPAPRLAQLGRKSIRSKEVIDFPFDEEPDLPLPPQRSGKIQEPPTSKYLSKETSAIHALSSVVGIVPSSPHQQSVSSSTERHPLGESSKFPIEIKSDAPSKEVASARRSMASQLVSNQPSEPSKEGPRDAQPQTNAPTIESSRAANKQDKVGQTVRAYSVPMSRSVKTPSLQRQHSDALRPSVVDIGLQDSEFQPELAPCKLEPQPVARLSNPATKGRKAAKPSDAAGQMPVNPFSLEPMPHSALHSNPKKTEAQRSTNEKEAAQMPGFSKASGGAWSIEAHDLFEFKRPG